MRCREATGLRRQLEDYKSMQWMVGSKDVPADWYSYPGNQPVDYKNPVDYKVWYPSDPGGGGWPPHQWGPEELGAPPQSYWAKWVWLNEVRAQRERRWTQQWATPAACVATGDKESEATATRMTGGDSGD
uniref:Uncharacterized protein n=1 Tax=Sphaerodactylus townsendi TaxID=933632 RepID=A0ACB8GB18_9SAUR